jgi:hypothetical protein
MKEKNVAGDIHEFVSGCQVDQVAQEDQIADTCM